MTALSGLAARLSAWDFDPPRLRYGLRTALAACGALLLSWALGLEHPQWSAMTVWAASQPAPGPLVEKSFFRAVGTIIGSAAGVLIMLASGGSPAILAPALAVWVGLCAAAGNVLRGFVAYGTLLAGYSAAMVTLLDAEHPDRILHLGADRMLTVLVGVLVALVVGLAFGHRAPDDLVTRTRLATARLLRLMADRLRGSAAPADLDGLLAEIAAIEEGLDPHGAGSLRSRRSARTLRLMVSAQVGAVLWLKRQRDRPAAAEAGAALAAVLADAASALERGAPAAEILAALDRAAGLPTVSGDLRSVVAELAAAVRARLAFDGDGAAPLPASVRLVLHRDWVGAAYASLRATATLLLVGAVWIATGWTAGAFVMLGTAVMITLFSTFETPASVMLQVLIGQIFGAAAALACRWLVWPAAGSGFELVLLMVPFMLFGAFPFAHRKAGVGGMDFNMIMLLLLQPAFPLSGSFGHAVAVALAVVAAPLIALVAFHVVFPTHPASRMTRLKGMMARELEAMAADPTAVRRVQTWHARLCHRVLVLVRLARRAADPTAPRFGLAVLGIGEAILALHALSERVGLRPAERRSVGVALARLGRLSRDPERAGRALKAAAAVLRRGDRPEADLVTEACWALAACADDFRPPARAS